MTTLKLQVNVSTEQSRIINSVSSGTMHWMKEKGHPEVIMKYAWRGGFFGRLIDNTAGRLSPEYNECIKREKMRGQELMREYSEAFMNPETPYEIASKMSSDKKVEVDTPLMTASNGQELIHNLERYNSRIVNVKEKIIFNENTIENLAEMPSGVVILSTERGEKVIVKKSEDSTFTVSCVSKKVVVNAECDVNLGLVDYWFHRKEQPLQMDASGSTTAYLKGVANAEGTPESVCETKESLKQLNRFETRYRSLNFITEPAQIDYFAAEAQNKKNKLSVAGHVFGKSASLQNWAWKVFLEQLKEKNPEVAMEYGSLKMQPKEIYKKIISENRDLNLDFDKVIVLDVRNRLSTDLYYSLHAVTDWFGGFFGNWFGKYMDGKMDNVPRPDMTDAQTAKFAKMLGEKDKTRAKATVDEVYHIAVNGLNFARDKMENSLFNVYLVGKEDIKGKSFDLRKLATPEEINDEVKSIRKEYARKMVQSKFYLQNQETAADAFLAIGAGMVSVYGITKLLENVSKGIATFIGGVGANVMNLITLVLGGTVKTGPNGEGRMQAQLAKISLKVGVFGVIGGTLLSWLSSHMIDTFSAATMSKNLFNLKIDLLYSLAGNCTTLTVSFLGGFGLFYRKVAKQLKDVGLLMKEESASKVALLEAVWNNTIFRGQAIFGSATLWITCIPLALTDLFLNPGKAPGGKAGAGVLFFGNASVESPGAMATFGYTVWKLMKNLKNAAEKGIDELA